MKEKQTKVIEVQELTQKEGFLLLKDSENVTYSIWPDKRQAYETAQTLKPQDSIKIVYVVKESQGKEYNNILLIYKYSNEEITQTIAQTTTEIEEPKTFNIKDILQGKALILDTCRLLVEKNFGTTIKEQPEIIQSINSLFISIDKYIRDEVKNEK
jgi:hypothetical protein